MPAIAEKHDANGGQVFRYAHTTEGWFFRIYEKDRRRYRVGKIEGALSKEEAIRDAYKVLMSFQTDTPRTFKQSKKRSERSIEEEVDIFLEKEMKRVQAGLKDDVAHERRRQSLSKMLRYLSIKKIFYPSKIDKSTFEDYPTFRVDARLNTVKTDLKDIRVFCRYHLAEGGLISNEIVSSHSFIPRIVITDDDLDANPAITPDDYRLINTFIRTEWMNTAKNRKGVYFRNLMWTFTHLLKNSGCRPSEMLALRRKDIEITNPKRWSESQEEWFDDFKLKLFIRKSKTGKKRDVLCRSNAGERLKNFIGFQNDYLNQFYPDLAIYPETLIFGKPEAAMLEGYSYNHFVINWRDAIINPLKSRLQGNKFSDRRYTLYSLRSTFIEDCITDNLDVYLVARLCGNSVDVIQKHYDRHDVLARADEVQYIDRGKAKRPEVEVVDLMDL